MSSSIYASYSFPDGKNPEKTKVCLNTNCLTGACLRQIHIHAVFMGHSKQNLQLQLTNELVDKVVTNILQI